jgi:3-hydroxyisobutyrate dehydrogenase-like beta-hydroxyacid dehydrogenase
VSRQARVVLISLPKPEHVAEVVRGGKTSLLSAADEGAVIIDLSTVDPETTRSNAAAAREAGVGYLDCPILGRPANAGRWTLPSGGEASDLEAVMPILDTISAKVIHVGPSGQGNMLKLLNNLMFGAINAITCEVFALGERLGMDPALFFDTVVDSGAGTVSNLFRDIGPRIVAGDFAATFSIDNLAKDVGLGIAMAQEVGMPMEVSRSGQRFNRLAQEAGLGGEDTAAVVKVFSDAANTGSDG